MLFSAGTALSRRSSAIAGSWSPFQFISPTRLRTLRFPTVNEHRYSVRLITRASRVVHRSTARSRAGDGHAFPGRFNSASAEREPTGPRGGPAGLVRSTDTVLCVAKTSSGPDERVKRRRTALLMFALRVADQAKPPQISEKTAGKNGLWRPERHRPRLSYAPVERRRPHSGAQTAKITAGSTDASERYAASRQLYR